MLQDRKQDMQALAVTLREELKHFEKIGVNKVFNNDVFQPVRNRLKGTPLRAYFMHKMYLIIQDRLGWNKKMLSGSGKHTDQFLVKIPFIFEVIITIQYLHNQVIDQKNGIDSLEKISNNLLIANLLKDYLYEYIESNFSGNLQQNLTKTVRKVFKTVDAGQLIEKQFNTFENLDTSLNFEDLGFNKNMDPTPYFGGIQDFLQQIKKELPRENREFASLYFKRVFMTCAALFTMGTELLCDHFNLDKNEKSELLNFATAYGMMRQLVNDNADFVPSSFELSTVSKLPEDAFSDLKNRNITLPLIFHLAQNPDSPVKDWLASNSKELSSEQENNFATLLKKDFSIFKSIQQTRLLATLAINYLNQNNEAGILLADTSQIAWWNKFLSPMVKSKAYKRFKKTAYYKRLKKQIQHQESSITTPVFEHFQNEKNSVIWPIIFAESKFLV